MDLKEYLQSIALFTMHKRKGCREIKGINKTRIMIFKLAKQLQYDIFRHSVKVFTLLYELLKNI